MQRAIPLCLCLALSSTTAVADSVAPFIHSALSLAVADDDQESRLRELIATHPGNAELQFRLGSLLSREQRWTEARQAYASANALAPEQADTLYNLAVCLDHLEQTVAASHYYQGALELAAEQAHNFRQAAAHQRLAQLRAALP